MASGDDVDDEAYQKGLDALSSLISGRVRADGKNWSHAFDMMQVYLERLNLDSELSKLSVIHVAGTKGKGSTCAMIESILRKAGYKTGLYTSPHLIDVRERIRINGVPIDKATFLRHMWAAYHTLADKADEDAGKPAYFRFLTLLGFKIFLEQKVDVAILEVGLGGRLDATNCVREPVVCGVTALGMDHVALLGDTLPKIAREKAGIFKPGKPAFTVPQRDDAQEALFEVAHKVGAPLEVVPALDTYCLESPSHGPAPPADPEHLELGLAGEHQRQNAALAVMLAAEWEGRSQAAAALQGEAARRRAQSVQSGVLPREYVAGLQAAKWPGRGQIIGYDVVEGQIIDSAASRLTFFLDGAHTAESMATCAHWFADASAAAAAAAGAARAAAAPDAGQNGSRHRDAAATDVRRVLLFNCLEERDANNLLRPLRSTLAARSAVPGAAIFVPPESTYMKLGPADAPPELAWQLTLRGVWERLGSTHTSAGGNAKGVSGAFPPLPRVPGVGAQDLAVGAVLPNLRGTLDWLRRCAREAPAVRMHVLVTGSLYLVGDLLKILGKGSE